MTELSDAQGVVRYLQKELAHGLKAEQAPPIGWRGHRTSQTRGYLVRPASAMREEARASLRAKRALRRAVKDGYEGEAAEQVAQAALLAQSAATWRLYRQNLRRRPLDLHEELPDNSPFTRVAPPPVATQPACHQAGAARGCVERATAGP